MFVVSSGWIWHYNLSTKTSACIRINGTYTGWFDIRKCQERVASSWPLNLFMDCCLYDLKEYECRIKMDQLYVVPTPNVCGRPSNSNKSSDIFIYLVTRISPLRC
ncbi:hypothetical protein EVAR_48710_1 [Eumeta japonica]|uniref:Uncharacterized protein n=1 Tax=Eumeta variegata TaxID=151549 RepID=A0A4C1XAS6_EUMVA|nr:hypothetical protein EVAR_48710_1 [Eumeta japonica]